LSDSSSRRPARAVGFSMIGPLRMGVTVVKTLRTVRAVFVTVNLSCLFIVLSAIECSATMIVVLGTRTHVVIGADSRRGSPAGDNENACKIRAGSRTAFIASGSYPPEGLLEEIWTRGEALAAGTGSAAERLQAMASALEDLSRTSPGFGGVKGAMAFVEMTANGPIFAGAQFTYEGARLRFTRSDRDWTRDEFVAGMVVLHNESYPRVVSEDEMRTSLGKRREVSDLATLARVSIEAQSLVDDTVGGATDLLVLDQQGSRWLQQKPVCQQSAAAGVRPGSDPNRTD
jgi:hypothetical protein